MHHGALLTAIATAIAATPFAASTPSAQAPIVGPPAVAASGPVVYTQGEFRGRSRRHGRDYVHIKVAVGHKLPFSTLTFRVQDARLLDGLQEGAHVEFRAARIDGENVLMELRRASR